MGIIDDLTNDERTTLDILMALGMLKTYAEKHLLDEGSFPIIAAVVTDKGTHYTIVPDDTEEAFESTAVAYLASVGESQQIRAMLAIMNAEAEWVKGETEESGDVAIVARAIVGTPTIAIFAPYHIKEGSVVWKPASAVETAGLATLLDSFLRAVNEAAW